MAFFYQLMADSLLSYIIATGIAVVALYVLSFWAMQKKNVFSLTVKNGNNKQLTQIAERIKVYFETNEAYKKENITLDAVGEELNTPAYLISKAINETYNITFPEFLTGLRIEDAKTRLMKDKNMAFSIEAIAYDSGFTTLSSFYSSFKKHVKMTPAEYRKRHSLVRAS